MAAAKLPAKYQPLQDACVAFVESLSSINSVEEIVATPKYESMEKAYNALKAKGLPNSTILAWDAIENLNLFGNDLVSLMDQYSMPPLINSSVADTMGILMVRQVQYLWLTITNSITSKSIRSAKGTPRLPANVKRQIVSYFYSLKANWNAVRDLKDLIWIFTDWVKKHPDLLYSEQIGQINEMAQGMLDLCNAATSIDTDGLKWELHQAFRLQYNKYYVELGEYIEEKILPGAAPAL